MRYLVLAIVTAVGVGLLGIGGASAAPASGKAIAQAAEQASSVTQVWGGCGCAARLGNSSRMLRAIRPQLYQFRNFRPTAGVAVGRSLMEIPKDALIPRHFNGTRRTSFWQLGDVRSDAPGFVAGEQLWPLCAGRALPL